MDKNELKTKISELEEKLEAARKKRDRIAMAVFSVVYLLIFYIFDKKPGEFEDYFNLVFASVVMGCMHHAINSAIYEELLSKDKYERWKLKELRKQLYELEESEFEEVMLQTKNRNKEKHKGVESQWKN